MGETTVEPHDVSFAFLFELGARARRSVHAPTCVALMPRNCAFVVVVNCSHRLLDILLVGCQLRERDYYCARFRSTCYSSTPALLEKLQTSRMLRGSEASNADSRDHQTSILGNTKIR